MTKEPTGLSKKILEEKLGKETAIVTLLQGQDADGAPGYVYIAVRTNLFKQFHEAYTKGPVDLEEWGVILAQGKGLPNDAVQKRMTEEYGFNHEGGIPLNNLPANLPEAPPEG